MQLSTDQRVLITITYLQTGSLQQIRNRFPRHFVAEVFSGKCRAHLSRTCRKHETPAIEHTWATRRQHVKIN